MNIRQAKKIIFSRHWHKRCCALRPVRFNEKTGHWEQPSFHDIPIPTWQKARHKYLGAMARYYNRHGHIYKED